MDNETQYDSDGAVFNGYDYSLQVWVVGGVVKMCDHAQHMVCICNGRKYAGRCVKYLAGHEVHKSIDSVDAAIYVIEPARS